MSGLMGRMVRGAVAGAAGTLAMDLVWYRRYRAGGGEDSFIDWGFATSTASFAEASAPGQVARKVTDAVGIDLPDRSAGLATNVMHWLTGLGYGVAHGLSQHRRNPLAAAVVTGAGALANSYVTLGALGVYRPVWEYDRETLTQDASAHLVFGVTTALTYRLLASFDGSR